VGGSLASSGIVEVTPSSGLDRNVKEFLEMMGRRSTKE